MPKPPPAGNFVSLPSATERRMTSPSPSAGTTRWANHLPSLDMLAPRIDRQLSASARVSGFFAPGSAGAFARLSIWDAGTLAAYACHHSCQAFRHFCLASVAPAPIAASGDSSPAT